VLKNGFKERLEFSRGEYTKLDYYKWWLL